MEQKTKVFRFYASRILKENTIIRSHQRATVMENYQLIIDDMDKAIHYLPKI